MIQLFRRKPMRPDATRVFRRFIRLIERKLIGAQKGSAPFAGAAAREKP